MWPSPVDEDLIGRLIAALLGITAMTAVPPASAQTATNIAWGGSNPGGVMYYMVGAAGTVITEKLPQ